MQSWFWRVISECVHKSKKTFIHLLFSSIIDLPPFRRRRKRKDCDRLMIIFFFVFFFFSSSSFLLFFSSSFFLKNFSCCCCFLLFFFFSCFLTVFMLKIEDRSSSFNIYLDDWHSGTEWTEAWGLRRPLQYFNHLIQ